MSFSTISQYAIAGLQLVSGVVGLIVVFQSGLPIQFVLSIGLLTLYSVVCGILVFRNIRAGYLLSALNQSFYALDINHGEFRFEYAQILSYDVSFLYSAAGNTTAIGFDIVALVLLLLCIWVWRNQGSSCS